MSKMIVDKEFVLARDAGDFVRYSKGEVDMPEADATHWYTLIFAKPVSEPVAEVEVVVEKKAAKGK